MWVLFILQGEGAIRDGVGIVYCQRVAAASGFVYLLGRIAFAVGYSTGGECGTVMHIV